MSVPNFSDEPSPSRSRSKYRSRGNSSLLPVLLGVGLLGAVAGIVVLVLNREQKPEKKDEAKADTTVTATSNKGERKQPAPPRPQDEPKSDRPKTDKTDKVEPPMTAGPPALINDSKVLRTTLEKCLGDEFALFDLNKTGLNSSFSAANAKVTLKNDVATLMTFDMCVVDTKFDFQREVFTVTTVPWLMISRKDGKRLVATTAYYLVFNCPAKEEDARRYSELFKSNQLAIQASFRIHKFTPFQEEGSIGYPNSKPVTSYLVETEVLAAKLGPG